MAIKKIRVPGPEGDEVITIDEWLHKPRFTTLEGNSASSIDLFGFSYVSGQQLPAAGVPVTGRRNSSDSDTNQVTRSRMNHDEAFIMYSITWSAWALEDTPNYANAPFNLQATAPMMRGTNVALLGRFALVDLLVGEGIDKPMATAPLSYYGQGVGAVAYASGDALLLTRPPATALNLNYGTGGSVNPRFNQRQWELPVIIHSDRVFNLHFHTPGGPVPGLNQDWRWKFYGDGLQRRPIG